MAEPMSPAAPGRTSITEVRRRVVERGALVNKVSVDTAVLIATTS